jgi:hypothetical protein
MAQRIQTVCDVHLERGEDVEASTWEVLARKAGTRTQSREVDLCDECAQVLATVAAFAAEHGRTQQMVGKTRPAVTPAAPRAAVTPVAAATDKGGKPVASCPVEGCGSVVQLSNLGRHVRQVHGLELGDVATAEAQPAAVHECPDCERAFTRPQALGAHRYQVHGYESPTRAERVERAERLGTEERAAS